MPTGRVREAFGGEFSDPEGSRRILDQLRSRPSGRPLRIMNVCGSHERAVTLLGLRRALAGKVRIIPGPGCPVCVCPDSDLRAAAHLALVEGVRLAAYGDLMRVPFSRPFEGATSLAGCRELGARIEVVSSPTEARVMAESDPGPAVFFSAGFETTTAPLAALVHGGLPPNLSLLLSHKRTSPAVRLLLEGGAPGFDALIAPGHVSAIVGADDWLFVAEDFSIAVAVCGFYDLSLLLGIRALWDLVDRGEGTLVNLYGQVVKAGGNTRALRWISEVFTVGRARWRGIGVLPDSGYQLSPRHAHLDARTRFGIGEGAEADEVMPAGCQCHEVVLGRRPPSACPLFGGECTPENPVGPCMVSGEGACRIWFRGGETL